MSWTLSRPDTQWVRTPEDVSRLRDRFEATHMTAIDTETTGLDIVRDQIMFWSLSFGDDRWFLDRKYLWEFEKVWADKRRTWIGTNTKYDAHMMANAGCDLAGDFIDTLVMDRLLNPDNDHGLKEVYEREFDEKMATFGETFYPKGPSGKPYKPKGESLESIMWKAWDEQPEKVVDYASLDAWGSYRVYKRLRKYLRTLITWRGITLWDIFCDFELPFTRVLYDMERRGMQIDTAYLKTLIPNIEEEQDKVKKRLAKAAGQIVNPNSPKQLIDLFIHKLKLPVLGKTKGGDPQMSEAVLSKYAKMGAKEAELVLRFRKLGKILGTYVLGLLNAVDLDGRVHGTFNQHRADTSRLSSADPNLQLEVVKPRELIWNTLKVETLQRGWKRRARKLEKSRHETYRRVRSVGNQQPSAYGGTYEKSTSERNPWGWPLLASSRVRELQPSVDICLPRVAGVEAGQPSPERSTIKDSTCSRGERKRVLPKCKAVVRVEDACPRRHLGGPQHVDERDSSVCNGHAGSSGVVPRRRVYCASKRHSSLLPSFDLGGCSYPRRAIPTHEPNSRPVGTIPGAYSEEQLTGHDGKYVVDHTKGRRDPDPTRGKRAGGELLHVQSSSMVKVQRPSRKRVGAQESLEARGPLYIGVMIWSDLTGNRERVSESGTRNKVQNIPRPDSDEFKLRQAFIARAGCVYVAADYDQIEMYLAAHFSEDQGMLNAIYAGRDLHSSNAALIWEEDYDEIVAAKKKSEGLTERDMQLREYRQFVKVIGFGQHTGRSKTCSKRGNLRATPPTAIPCCVARRSVSTCWDRSSTHSMRNRCPSGRLVTPPTALTRQALCVKLSNPTLSRCVNAATRSSSMTAPGTSLTLSCSRPRRAHPAATSSNQLDLEVRRATPAHQNTYYGAASADADRRYSQYPWKQGINTLLYGKGPNRLADELKFMEKVKKENPKWSEKRVKSEAKKMAVATTEKFFSGIPGVRAWIDQTHRRAAETKYVESLSGRRRWLQQIMDWDERVAHQKEAEEEALLRHRDPASAMCWCDDCRESRAGDRRAVNTIIQGSAADIIQKAMIKNHEDPYLSEVDTILQVHDENGFEVPEPILQDAMDRIKHNMEHPGYDDLLVPLKCDPESGPSWLAAK